MRKRFLTMLLGLGLVLSMFVGTLSMASADHTGTQDVYFPWLPNGAELVGVDGTVTGPWYGTATVQNLEDVPIEVDFYVGDPGSGFTLNRTENVDPKASTTVSVAELAGSGDGFAVKAVGYVQREETNDDDEVTQEEIRAHITGAAKNVSDEPSSDGKTNSGHISVDGYTGMTENQVGSGTHILPLVQTNTGWNTEIKIANFAESGGGESITVTFYAAGEGQTSGSSGTFSLSLDPGEVEKIDLMEDTALGAEWVGSAWISSSSTANIGAVAERIKTIDDMMLSNTSRPTSEGNGTKYAPLVFQNYNFWNTGISVANLSDSENTVTVDFVGPTTSGQISETMIIEPRGMDFVFIPGLQELGIGDEGFVGSAVIHSETGGALHASIDQVKYYGSGQEVGSAMSYIAEHDTAGDGNPEDAEGDALALPIYSKGTAGGSGDTSGIQLFNASVDHSVNAHVTFYDQTGAKVEPTINAPRSVQLAPHESRTIYALQMPSMPEGFFGSAIVQVSGEGELVGVSNNVNYDVSDDGSVAFNLIRIPGEPQEPTATRFTIDPETDTNIWGDTHEITVTVYDQFDNVMEDVGVQAEITEGPHRTFSHEDDEKSGTTDSNGEFVISYLGGNVHHGLDQDTINVQVDGIDGSKQATKTWIFGDPTTIELTHLNDEGEPVEGIAENVIYFDEHTVQAIVRDQNGNLLPDAEVNFDVDAADSGLERLFLTSDTVETNNDGEAEFEYVAQYPGTDAAYADVITASVDGITSNEVVKIWRNLELTLAHVDDPVDPPNVTHVSSHTVEATLVAPAYNFVSGPATGSSAGVTPVEGADINFTVSGANTDGGTATTDASGNAQFTYEGTEPGEDDILAELDADATNYNATVSKTWYDLLVDVTPDDDINAVGDQHTVTAQLGYDIGGGFVPLTTDMAGYGMELLIPAGDAHPQGPIQLTSAADGTASYTYTGSTTGTDNITVTLDANGASDTVTKLWQELEVSIAHEGDPVNFVHIESHTVSALVSEVGSGDPVDDVEVEFYINDANAGADVEWSNNDAESGAGTTGTTGADGLVYFTYTGTIAGGDNLQASINEADTYADETLHKTWEQVYLNLEHVDPALFDEDADAAVNEDGTDHTVEVTLVDGDDNLLSGYGDFDAMLWINGDTGGTFNTGAAGGNALTLVGGSGQFTYNYTSSGAEVMGDVHDLSATLDVAAGTGNEIESNEITKIWYAPEATNISLSAGEQYAMEAPSPTEWDAYDVTAYVTDQYGQPFVEADGVTVDFTYESSDPAGQGALQDPDTLGAVSAVNGVVVNDDSEAMVTVVSDRNVDDRPLTSTIGATSGGAYAEIDVTFTATPLVITNIDLAFDPPAINPVYATEPNVEVTATVYDQFGAPMNNILVTFEMLDDMGATGPVNNWPSEAVGLRDVGDNFAYEQFVTEPTDVNGEATVLARKSIFTPVGPEGDYVNAFVTAYAGQDPVVQATEEEIGEDPGTGDPHEQEIIWVPIPGSIELSPFYDLNYIGETDHTVDAQILDQYGDPLAVSADIDFTAADQVNGEADETGTESTSAGTGATSWTYDRDVEAEDMITASATVSWDFGTGFNSYPITEDFAVFKDWEILNVVVSPATDFNFSLVEEHTFTAQLVDGDGDPVFMSGVDIFWEFDSTDYEDSDVLNEVVSNELVAFNPTAGTATGETDAAGQATFTYTGNVRDDGLTYTHSLLATPEHGGINESDTGSKTWNPIGIEIAHEGGSTDEAFNAYGDSHTVVAQLVDDVGDPIGGLPVEVEFFVDGIVAGTVVSSGWHDPADPPSGNADGSGDTNASGQIAFSYTYDGAGADETHEISAFLVDSTTTTSNVIEKTWYEPVVTFVTLSAGEQYDHPGNANWDGYDITATMLDQNSNPMEGETVEFVRESTTFGGFFTPQDEPSATEYHGTTDSNGEAVAEFVSDRVGHPRPMTVEISGTEPGSGVTDLISITFVAP